jgi:hypothetical protein
LGIVEIALESILLLGGPVTPDNVLNDKNHLWKYYILELLRNLSLSIVILPVGPRRFGTHELSSCGLSSAWQK